MEPANDNNQTSGTTPDLERLADELTKANVPSVTPAAEPSPDAPTTPIDSTPTSEPAPAPNPVTPPTAPDTPTPAPAPSPATPPAVDPAAPATPEPEPIVPAPESAPAPAPGPIAPAPEPAPSPMPEPAPVAPAPASASPITPPADFSTPVISDSMTNPMSDPMTSPISDPMANPLADSMAGPMTNPLTDPMATDPMGAAPADTPATPVLNTPIQPAAPVPGSIGSSQSYVEPAAQPMAQPASQSAAEDKPKLSRTTIIIIILAAVVLIGGIALAVILMTSSSSQPQSVSTGDSKYVPVVEEVEPVLSGLTCVAADPDAAYLESIGNPRPFTGSVKISYVDDEFTNWTQAIEATYPSSDAAMNGLASLQAQYDLGISDAGLAADPMVTSYSISNNTLLLSHSIDLDSLTLPAAQYMGIDVADITSVDDLDLSYDTLESLYATLGYTCSETEEDELLIEEETEE